MPRIFKKKGNVQSWHEDSMSGAISNYVEKKMGFSKAAETFGVPRSTLKRRINQLESKKLSVEQASVKKNRFQSYFYTRARKRNG